MKKTMIVAIAILAIVLGIVAYASAAADTVSVTANVNPKLSVTVSKPTLLFSQVAGFLFEPETTYSDSVTVAVKSNNLYSFEYTTSGFAPLGLSHAVTLGGVPVASDATKNKAQGNTTYADAFSMTIPMTTDADAGPYFASATYTVLQ